MATTQERLGAIDVLVCNAASNPYYGPQAGISDEQFRKVLDNNIVSNHWLCQLVAPQMMARRDGSIIIVSSIGGLRGSPVIGAYCISKAADMQLARNLAVEFGPHQVRVNCIAPGLIKTDFARALWEDEALLAERNATTPLRRIGDPDEIAGAAVFLASKASTFMTGQTLVMQKAHEAFDKDYAFDRVETVGPRVSGELVQSGTIGVVLSVERYVTVPLPWEVQSLSALAYLPEQLVWYGVVAPAGTPPAIVSRPHRRACSMRGSCCALA